MQITRVQPNLYYTKQNIQKNTNNKSSYMEKDLLSNNVQYGYNNYHVSFGESNTRNLTVQDIDHNDYKDMKEHKKSFYRKRYENFCKDNINNKENLVDQNFPYLPLRSEESMDKFIEITNMYSKFRENPIICLGRSPKWFLNASLWMKDGIKDYKFVAFSGRWYRPDAREGVVRMNSVAPTEEQITEYRKYLKRKKVDPESIVERMEKTGKKTIITDYIHSGKGATSFLEIMGNYAKDQGVLEEFSKSIHIVGIGSRRYYEEMNPYAESIPDPKVIMPEVLWPYERNIGQEFHNMDYTVFCEMLLNQNANECRSTYYPADAWLIYNPDRFKTGLIKELKKVDGIIASLIEAMPKNANHIAHFKPIMRDYRNLLNFRILDGLSARGLLKKVHKAKI